MKFQMLNFANRATTKCERLTHWLEQNITPMVIILEGSSINFAHMKARLKKKKIFHIAPVNVNKCLKQIKLPATIHTCAMYFDTPSAKSTIIAPAIYGNHRFKCMYHISKKSCHFLFVRNYTKMGKTSWT